LMKESNVEHETMIFFLIMFPIKIFVNNA